MYRGDACATVVIHTLFREIKTTALSSSVKAKVKIIWLLDGGF